MFSSIKKSIVILCLGIFLFIGKSMGQELNCQVSVSAPTIQLTNRDVFKNMETQIREFMNGRKWTNDVFAPAERIDCTIGIIISNYSGTNFSGTMQIVSSRPVYGTNYPTTVFNCLDKYFSVNYVQFQPFEYQENTYITEMTSILAYYAYIILGYDYDSFSKFGGTQFFQKAQSIVNSAQSSNVTGWSPQDKDDHNRYFLINELTDERFKPFREGLYNYHRMGLDNMAEDNGKGLDKILASLQAMNELHQSFTSSYVLNLYFMAKSSELIDLFAQAPSDKKSTARDLLTHLDPLNTDKYNEKLQ